MKNQQGSALVIVMALLSGALMLGMSGMQSALIDERLAGNFRAFVRDEMNAEDIQSALYDNENARNNALDEIAASLKPGDEIDEEVNDILGRDVLRSFVDDLLPENYDELSESQQTEILDSLIDCMGLSFKRLSGSHVAVTATATCRQASGSSTVVYAFEEDTDESSPPFQFTIVGCEGVSSGGGSTISSYRSSEGGWSGQPGRFAEQNIPLIRTTADNANVAIGDSEKIHGGIEALGTVTLNGSSEVYGDINANKNITLNTSSLIHGDVSSKGVVKVGPATVLGSIFSDGNVTLDNGGTKVEGDVESFADVIFSSSGRVGGVVKAGGDVDLRGWSASVGKGIYAQGGIYSPRTPPYNPPEGHVDNGSFFPNTPVSIAEIEEVEPQSCDTVDFADKSLSNEMARYQNELDSLGNVVVNNGVVDIMMTPNRISVVGSNEHEHINGAESDVDTVFGEDAPIYYVDDLKMASTSKLHIRGGDVVLVIGGDFSMDGGGEGLVIDLDSSLTVFVAGQTDLGSVLKMPVANSINNNGKPTFSLFSGYSGAGTGVNFRSSNRVVANVYAPYSRVSVNTGASLFGSVKGRNVNVDGGSKIVYDELLAESFCEPSNGSPETGGDGGWQLVGWQ